MEQSTGERYERASLTRRQISISRVFFFSRTEMILVLKIFIELYRSEVIQICILNLVVDAAASEARRLRRPSWVSRVRTATVSTLPSCSFAHSRPSERALLFPAREGGPQPSPTLPLVSLIPEQEGQERRECMEVIEVRGRGRGSGRVERARKWKDRPVPVRLSPPAADLCRRGCL